MPCEGGAAGVVTPDSHWSCLQSFYLFPGTLKLSLGFPRFTTPKSVESFQIVSFGGN